MQDSAYGKWICDGFGVTQSGFVLKSYLKALASLILRIILLSLNSTYYYVEPESAGFQWAYSLLRFQGAIRAPSATSALTTQDLTNALTTCTSLFKAFGLKEELRAQKAYQAQVTLLTSNHQSTRH